MTAPLGPCPVCGAHGAWIGTDHGLAVCSVFKCDFRCQPKYWSLLRRKMTREDAQATWDTALRDCLNDKTEHALRKMGAVIIAALTGEET